MVIPRSYFRHLARLALDLSSAAHCLPLRRVALSTSCIFYGRSTTLSVHNSTTSRSFTTTLRNSAAKKNTWVRRQSMDFAAREAKVLQYRSRAAFKLLEIDQTHKIFSPGMTVVDLGFAPGSWSQVAVAQTHPGGRVIGIDLLPAQPPKGVSSIQGDFLDAGVQASVRRYLSDPNRGRSRLPQSISNYSEKPEIPFLRQSVETTEAESPEKIKIPILQLDDTTSSGYIAQERRDSLHDEEEEAQAAKTAEAKGMSAGTGSKDMNQMAQEEIERNTVDVVLSDMCEPWPLISGFHMNTVVTPWILSNKRLMNTSGVSIKDHTGSMELCNAALTFCIDVLKPGGSFVCKFYQGPDDYSLESMVRRVFLKVVRMKPETSRPDSKECYFVATKKKDGVTRKSIEI